jgi:hypothetical protein
MKKKSNPIDEVRDRLFNIEVSLHLVQEDMSELSLNLISLNKLQKDLMYNLDFHKKGGITTSIGEYKKSVKDLEKVRIEMQKIVNMEKNLEDKLKKLIKEHDFYNSQYEALSFEENGKVLKMENYDKKNNKRKNRK